MAEDLAAELQSASSWDVATRYHEFKSRLKSSPDHKLIRSLRAVAAEAVLLRARDVLGSLVHPTTTRLAHWDEVPADAEQIDFDIEETLDESPRPTVDDIIMSYKVRRRQSVVLCVDTSLSMTGQKLALTAVALAVVLLQFPEDPVAIVAFENEAKVLKRSEEKLGIAELVERFLDVPAQGYTHLEDGLRVALKLSRLTRTGVGRGQPVSVVLLTDGKYTAGRDPAYLAPQFDQLTVLKMGVEKASMSLCFELAQKGRGLVRVVEKLEVLPTAMYGVVKAFLTRR